MGADSHLRNHLAASANVKHKHGQPASAGGEDFVAGVYSLTDGVRSAPWLAVPSGGTGS